MALNTIQEAHPLKQGLKLILSTAMPFRFVIQEAHPLKQGLKPEAIEDAQEE